MPYNNSYRALWKAAGYSTTLGSCATGRPPPPTWLRLFHLTSAKHALSDIVHSRLKVAQFKDLNDPFELMALSFAYGQVRRLVREYRAGFDATTGLVCFSEDWTSPVMWSHYADKHKGICLGFDVRRSSVKQVDYKEKRLLPDLGGSEEPFGLTEAHRDTLNRTKCHEWKYEREWRMFVDLATASEEGAFYFRDFDKDIRLAEVILGNDCELSAEEVRRVVDRHHAKVCVYKARLAIKHFKVVPVESSVP